MEPRQVEYDAVGDGPAVVLVHSDIADARLWRHQVEALRPTRRVVTYDRPGFGRTPLPPGPFSDLADLLGLLDRLGVERASLVGCSNGGRIALELALTDPERVDRLVLVAPGLPGYEHSAEMRAADAEEIRLFEAGDDEGAADAQVRFWAVGRRRPEDVDPAVLEYTRAAALHAYAQYRAVLALGGYGPTETLDPPAAERLAEVRAPTLLVVGEADAADCHGVVDRLAAEIPGARKEVVAGAAHMLPLERPDELNRLLLEFLS